MLTQRLWQVREVVVPTCGVYLDYRLPSLNRAIAPRSANSALA